MSCKKTDCNFKISICRRVYRKPFSELLSDVGSVKLKQLYRGTLALKCDSVYIKKNNKKHALQLDAVLPGMTHYIYIYTHLLIKDT